MLLNERVHNKHYIRKILVAQVGTLLPPATFYIQKAKFIPWRDDAESTVRLEFSYIHYRVNDRPFNPVAPSLQRCA